MQKLLIIVLLLFCISCKKDGTVKPYSFVSVKFIEDEDYVFIETTEGSWDKNKKLAELNATGYKNERLSLYLPNLSDTGIYPNPTIKNITYTDGLDFRPFKLNAGFIHIDFIDSLSVRGDFKVLLEDDFNGAETRTVVGSFGINTH
jgi:hypothetical protein